MSSATDDRGPVGRTRRGSGGGSGSRIVPTGDLDSAVGVAVEKIEAGLPVGLPTDTVYVLASDPADPGATDRMFALKQRQRAFDLSVLVGSADEALELAIAVPKSAVVLMERFWPGPLTLVLPQNPHLDLALGDDELTIGVRMPDHEVPRAVIAETGALAATPAGPQGGPAFETAPEVADAFRRWIPVVLDAGRCARRASTVVDATGEELHLLREGPLTWQDISAAVG